MLEFFSKNINIHVYKNFKWIILLITILSL